MILPVIFCLLCAVLTVSSLDEGENCNLSNGSPGICTVVNRCPVVFQQLMAGSAPDFLCGYSGFDPVVCCPRNTPSTTTTTTPRPTAQPQGDGRGVIARRKCAEYAQSVYTLKYPPTLVGNRKPINVSQCAVRSQKLIVGGVKAERMEFPHMVAVGYRLGEGTPGIGWYCGATLISETHAVTAAHCTYSSTWGDAEWVRAGDLNLISSADGASPIDRRIVKRIRHPSYKPPSQYHDIAVLGLESRLPFNAWIRPACLHIAPSTGTEKAIATGWGRVDWSDDEGSSDLLKVTLPLVDQTTCNRSYTSGTTDIKLSHGIERDSQICAGEPGMDTCQGDSGGPLVIFSNQVTYYCMYDVIGVTSLGRLCGSVIPGIYTRIYNYVPWIESIVWPSG